MTKKTIFLTGATGVMGGATLKLLAGHFDRLNLRLLVRDTEKNRKKLKPYLDEKAVKIVWGDLVNPEDVKRALGTANIVLHIGGMVSPQADYDPEKTLKVNVAAMKNIISAARDCKERDNIKVIYIGSVAQTSDRREPLHWSRTGDPVRVSAFDAYGLSKNIAERMLAESGINYWVSLRQSGILHPGIFRQAFDPIAFHVPLKGALEWTTLEDSANLMLRLCGDDVPEHFWNKFYNIGSGDAYRLGNFEFISMMMKAIGAPPPEKIFEPSWFATRNFHGSWFIDSDKLEEMLHFRENTPVEDYFKEMVKQAPWWVRLAPLAPAPVEKMVMKTVASKKPLGPLFWLKSPDHEDYVKAFFGSREEQKQIPGWEQLHLVAPSKRIIKLSHGYDESKADDELDIADMKEAAEFRGGKCLSEEMLKGDLLTPLEWECHKGHKFEATPNLILKGGHWCPECLTAEFSEERDIGAPFFSQTMVGA